VSVRVSVSKISACAFSPLIVMRPRHLSEPEIRDGNRPGDRDVIDKYLEFDHRYVAQVQPGSDPGLEEVSGMRIVCFAPVSCARTNLNNHSLVTFLESAGFVVCLPGDNEAPSWRELLEIQDFRGWLARTDVFIASHHGREAGYCVDVFDNLCKPRLVVVSDGPGSETSAVGKYGTHASGWLVTSRSTGRQEDRSVVTTRSDGSIYIEAGRDCA
jgi:hypothetical protein